MKVAVIHAYANTVTPGPADWDVWAVVSHGDACAHYRRGVSLSRREAERLATRVLTAGALDTALWTYVNSIKEPA